MGNSDLSANANPKVQPLPLEECLDLLQKFYPNVKREGLVDGAQKAIEKEYQDLLKYHPL